MYSCGRKEDNYPMKLLFYAPVLDRDGKRLLKNIKKITLKYDLEIFGTLEELKLRLHQPIGEKAIAVLLTASEEELRNIQTMRDAILEIHTILVVPDQTKNIIQLAHRLHPRFLTYKNNDFQQLSLVLRNMMAGQSNPGSI